MAKNNTPKIKIETQSKFLSDKSEPSSARFAFSYSITISNVGEIAAKLLSRHWLITDANGQVKEISGVGVVGKQPYLAPGKSFSYTSCAILETPVGSMHGSYEMVTKEGGYFETKIPAFSLAIDLLVH